MKITVKAILAVLSLLFACQACSTASARDQGKGAGRTIIVRKEQSGLELRVRPGEMIRVELQTQGGTGYAWYPDHLNSDHLELLSKETIQESQRDKIGAPVTSVWLFRARKEGSSEIKLNYFRNWEGKDASSDHFIVKVHITGTEKLEGQ